MTRIALLRHFPTSWNAEHRIQGRTDIPLTDASREMLHGLDLPAPWHDVPLYASPLSRARETAEILARGRALHIDDRLIELNYGDWEGQKGVDLLADPSSDYSHVEDGGWYRRPPGGGESHWDGWLRVRPLLAEVAAQGPAVIVAHRALMRTILAHAWNWGFDVPEPFRIRRSHLHPVSISPDGDVTDPGPLIPLEPFE